MNHHPQALLSRRQMLISGAAGAGALAVLVPAQGTVLEVATSLAAEQRVSLLLHDRRIAPDAALVERMHARSARIMVLAEDPVRQWRDQSGDWLQRSDTRLMGITRWPDFLMLRGLAAESRRHVRFASPVSADGVLTWLIA
jgi:hypothetical protein